MTKWAITLALLLASAPPALAQLAVSDAATEASTAETAAELGATNQEIANDVAENTLTANSVITPGDPGLFQPVNGFLDQEMALLASGNVTAQAMAAMFPGFQLPNPDNMLQDTTIAANGLATYYAAEQAAEDQGGDFDAEAAYLQSIEAANTASVSVLGAIQIQTEATLAVASQIMMERQLQISEIRILSLDAAYRMDNDAQQAAADAAALNQGEVPQ